MIDNMEDKELLQNSIKEFGRIQNYMILAERESDVYKAMQRRYIELKVILTTFDINLKEFDIIKE